MERCRAWMGRKRGALRRAGTATAGPSAASIMTRRSGTPFGARRRCYLATASPYGGLRSTPDHRSKGGDREKPTTRDVDWHGISPEYSAYLIEWKNGRPSSRAAIVWKFSLRRLRAAGLRTQRQSLAPPAIEEPLLADLHSAMSAARAGRQEIPAHRDEQRPFLC